MGKKGLTVVDLFCGAGGLSAGLAMSGRFSSIEGFDNDPDSLATWAANHGSAGHQDVMPADLTILRGEPGVDVVVGGPPCQGFSMAGKRSAKDPRNALVFHFARLVGEFSPRFFVMENVPGLKSARDENDMPVLGRLLSEYMTLGYQTRVVDIDAARFGVPQKRRRILILGAKRDEILPVIQPTTPTERPVTVKQALSGIGKPMPISLLSSYKRAGSKYAKMMRGDESMLHDHVETKHRGDVIERLEKLPPGESLYPSYKDSWKRLHLDRPAPTVKENHNAPFVHPTEPRVLTPRECARLQSFPDWFHFAGTKSSMLKQIGNAVPPLVGKAIGEAVYQAGKSNMGR